jgi:succinyl-CoA synthetase beta subunit
MAAAQEMVADLRSLPLLCGYRGRPKGDLGALARALAALSQLAHDDSILEAEINPLLVLPEGKGVVALDALVRLK